MKEVPADFAANVCAIFADFDRSDSPGAVVSVRQRDEGEVFFGAFGMSNINEAVPLSRQSVIRIGSQSKQFTVLLTLMLEAEGKLSLDDSVQKYLPFLPNFSHPVLLRHLATNTSGWRDHFQALVLSGVSLYTPSGRQETLDAVTRQEALNFAPGSASLYSNSGFVFLSEIIQKIEDKPLDEVLQDRIFRPLGMTHSRLIGRDGLAVLGLATHYCKGDDGWYALNWGLPIGGEGGIASSVDDMALWLDNFDSPHVGTSEMIRRMQTPPRFPNGTLSGYGMGLLVQDYRGEHYIGHGGSVAGGRSEGGRFTDAGLSVILLGNCDRIAPMPMLRRIADAWFGNEAPEPPAFRPGRYRERNGSEVLSLRIVGGQPQIMSSGTGFDSLDCADPLGASREGGLINAHFRPADDGGIEGDFCGQPRRYDPVAEDTSSPPLNGRYRNLVQRFHVAIETDTHSGRFELRSDLGIFRGDLEALSEGLWLLRPAGAPSGPQTPWMAVITTHPDGFSLSTARNKNIPFTAETQP